jgi:hypothetical protein
MILGGDWQKGNDACTKGVFPVEERAGHLNKPSSSEARPLLLAISSAEPGPSFFRKIHHTSEASEKSFCVTATQVPGVRCLAPAQPFHFSYACG